MNINREWKKQCQAALELSGSKLFQTEDIRKMAKIHVDIDPKLKHDLKVVVAEKGIKLKDAIAEMVKIYVKKNKS